MSIRAVAGILSRTSRDPDPPPRRILLTGATGGLGPSIAAALARTGSSLALSALPGPELQDVADRVGRTGDDAVIVALPADLREPRAPERLVAGATDALGGIDVLVHNAGLETVGRYTAQSPEALEAVVRVNLLSALHLARLVLPGMVERGSGHLVFVSSMAGRTAPGFTGAYAASKAGLGALARSLRAEYRGSGISASAVVPGFLREVGMYGRARREAGFRGSLVLGTVSAAEVADAVIRAIERDRPEILVQRGPVRLALALAELFPRLVGERLNRWAGAKPEGARADGGDARGRGRRRYPFDLIGRSSMCSAM